jgi:hypothetical protein
MDEDIVNRYACCCTCTFLHYLRRGSTVSQLGLRLSLPCTYKVNQSRCYSLKTLVGHGQASSGEMSHTMDAIEIFYRADVTRHARIYVVHIVEQCLVPLRITILRV